MNISPHDEALLSWFYGQGQTVFERSTVGPMLERAELFGFSGELLYNERWRCYEAQTTRIHRERPVWARVEGGELVYNHHEVTARPTAETRSGSGYIPNLQDVERHAEVSRVLCALERKSQLAVAVLECFYGDLGAQWAQKPKPGKLASLYHLTQAGQRLLEASGAEARAKGQPVAGTAARRMANEIGRSRQPERVRAALLRCERQALELRHLAVEQWCAARERLREAGRAA